jgi:16S rRNA (guanine527-N7)-methyltransferase
MSAPLDLLESGGRAILGRPLEQQELASFGKYLTLLIKWQMVQRLVGSSDPEWIVEHLFLDSLLFLRVLPPELESLADVGSGAGFPGIPIKIVRPDLRMTLIESRQRRVSFLSAAVRELGLDRIQLLNERLEHLGRETEGTFGAVVMRCAGDPEVLLPNAKRLVSHGGAVVLSGPPEQRPISAGKWTEVQGVRPGHTRRFVVYRV